MTRRRFGALVAATAVMVAACGGTTPSTAPATQAPATQAPASGAPATEAPSQDAGAPKPGGTLVVGIEGDMVRSDMALVSDLNSSYVLQQVVEGLVSLAPGTGDEIVPALATDWTISDDGLTYTFNLRDGVTFHDGTPVNAEAVKYNFDRWLNFPQSYIDAGYTYYADSVIGHGDTSFVESVTVVDENTVEVKRRNPNSAFLLQLTLTPFAIQSPTAIEAGNGNAPNFADNKYAVATQAPGAVGTGPFVFQEWVSGDHVTLTKNPSYWNAANGGPYLDTVTFRPRPDTTARLNDLMSGGIDIAQALAPVDVPSLQGDPDVSPIDRGSACNLGVIGMNQGHKPFDNPSIRKAVAAAVDRQALVDAFFAGVGTKVDNRTPPGSPFEKPLAFPAYDPDAARALIAESGLSGDDLSFEFWYPSNTTRAYMPDPKGQFDATLTMLEAVGLKPIPKTVDWDQGYVDGWNKGEYAMFQGGWNCDWFGIDNFLYTAFFGYQGGNPNPSYDYKNDEMNQAMVDALASTDEATQAENWGKAQDFILADIPSVPIGSVKTVGGIANYVKGFAPSPTQTEFFTNVWLDQ